MAIKTKVRTLLVEYVTPENLTPTKQAFTGFQKLTNKTAVNLLAEQGIKNALVTKQEVTEAVYEMDTETFLRNATLVLEAEQPTE